MIDDQIVKLNYRSCHGTSKEIEEEALDQTPPMPADVDIQTPPVEAKANIQT